LPEAGELAEPVLRVKLAGEQGEEEEGCKKMGEVAFHTDWASALKLLQLR
jgi:hypothetical protein